MSFIFENKYYLKQLIKLGMDAEQEKVLKDVLNNWIGTTYYDFSKNTDPTISSQYNKITETLKTLASQKNFDPASITPLVKEMRILRALIKKSPLQNKTTLIEKYESQLNSLTGVAPRGEATQNYANSIDGIMKDWRDRVGPIMGSRVATRDQAQIFYKADQLLVEIQKSLALLRKEDGSYVEMDGSSSKKLSEQLDQFNQLVESTGNVIPQNIKQPIIEGANKIRFELGQKAMEAGSAPAETTQIAQVLLQRLQEQIDTGATDTAKTNPIGTMDGKEVSPMLNDVKSIANLIGFLAKNVITYNGKSICRQNLQNDQSNGPSEDIKLYTQEPVHGWYVYKEGLLNFVKSLRDQATKSKNQFFIYFVGKLLPEAETIGGGAVPPPDVEEDDSLDSIDSNCTGDGNIKIHTPDLSGQGFIPFIQKLKIKQKPIDQTNVCELLNFLLGRAKLKQNSLDPKVKTKGEKYERLVTALCKNYHCPVSGTVGDDGKPVGEKQDDKGNGKDGKGGDNGDGKGKQFATPEMLGEFMQNLPFVEDGINIIKFVTFLKFVSAKTNGTFLDKNNEPVTLSDMSSFTRASSAINELAQYKLGPSISLNQSSQVLKSNFKNKLTSMNDGTMLATARTLAMKYSILCHDIYAVLYSFFNLFGTKLEAQSPKLEEQRQWYASHVRVLDGLAQDFLSDIRESSRS